MTYAQLIEQNWFKFVFSLFTAVLGFTIANNETAGKIASAVIFFLMGWLVSWILQIILRNIKIKTVVIVIEIILCVLVAVFAFSRDFVDYHATDYRDHSPKVKCAMCGKKVRQKQMIGKWCEDCNEDAFGEDGWYDDIKD